MVPRKRRAAVFSFSSPSFRSAFPPPFSSSSLPQVQILVRVPAAERQKQEQKEGDTKKPHFELLEGCRPETTVADLKRQVEFFFFFFLLSPFGVFLFLFTFSLPNGDALSRSLHLSLFLFLFSLPCSATPATDAPSSTSASAVPTPLVVIDNTSDSFATVVTLKFGDRLGELLDTVAALRNLGLNIRRAKVSAAGGANKFFITDAATSEKVRVVFFMFFFF